MFVFVLSSPIAWAQESILNGKVIDQTGSGLPGATVQLKGANRGTTTDAAGSYRLTNVPPNSTLVISSIGYTSQEVSVGSRSEVNISLVEDTKALTEVVVVGYGTVRRKDATGAVDVIGPKDFTKGIISSPEQLLQGRVAGVQISQSSGEPGGGINVRIRGTSSVYGGNNPLFVIDGVPLSGDNTTGDGDASGVGRQSARNPLNFLNPNDIASIDILKDASATAIYGSRGANGVVLITTKKGKQGRGVLDYSYALGISTITKKYDLLSASEFAAANPTQDQKSSTDWQDEIFRTAATQQHNMSFGGGDATGTYRFSLGYLNQDGIIEKSNLTRYSFGLNGNKSFINNRLTVGANVNLANTQDTGVPISENSGFTGDLLGGVLKSNPTMAIYKADGVTYNQLSLTEPNPVAFLNLSRDNTSALRALGNLNAEIQIVNGLKFKTVLGFDQSFSSRKSAYSGNLLIEGVATLDSGRIKPLGRAYFREIQTDNRLLESYFTYDKELNANATLNATLGYSYQSFERTTRNTTAYNFKTTDLDLMVNNLASANNSIVTNSGNTLDELQSVFGRANVSLADKYLFTGTLRVDGSSRFGGNNKYGYFPSFAFKWKLINEDFAPKDVFSDLSLRLGYGVTGNQNIPHNLYDKRDRYSDWAVDIAGAVTGGGLNAVSFNNPNLKWETTSAFNLGIDFAVLNNRITGNINLYDKHTKDLLFQVVSAQPAPTPFVWKNLDTDIQNRGIELGLTASMIDRKDFSWEMLFNVAYNKNLVKNLEGVYDTGEINGQGLSGAFAQRLAEGQPLFAYFLREFGGFDESGNSIYVGGDFQKFIDGKSPLPTLTSGFTNNFKYRNLDLSLFFNGVFGSYIYSNTANAFFTQGSFANGRNVTKDVLTNGEGGLNAPDVSTRFLEKGDFVRLQNLSLGYNLALKSKAISSVRVFLTGQNLLTFTSYSGQDPEVSTNKSLNGIPSFGIDYTAYPRARTWTVGANISF